MNGRHDNVRGFFIVQLNNVLTHIRLKRLNAMFAEVLIHGHFFTDHGFAFNHLLGIAGLRDLQNNGIGFICAAGPMYLDTLFG